MNSKALSLPLFQPGRCVMTCGFKAEAAERYDDPERVACGLINRHISGDWGDTDEGDFQANADAVRDGERVVSIYRLRLTPDEKAEGVERGPKVYVITEWDRSYTTVMLAEEY